MERKINFNVTIDPDLAAWIDRKVQLRTFSSRSHALESMAYQKYMEELGVPQYMDLPQVPQRSLPGWDAKTQIDQTFWTYKYSREVGTHPLEIETDKSQRVFRGKIWLGGYPLDVHYDMQRARWVGFRIDVPFGYQFTIPSSVYINEQFNSIEELADFLVKSAEKLEEHSKAIAKRWTEKFYPDRPEVSPKKLDGWFLNEIHGGYYWTYTYHKQIGEVMLTLKSDKSQTMFRGQVNKGIIEQVDQDPDSSEWSRHIIISEIKENGGIEGHDSQRIKVDQPIKNLEDLARYLQNYAELIQAT